MSRINRNLVLPRKRSEVKQKLEDYTLLIYGREKIGKTSLAAQFPGAVFLMFEPGGKALSIYQVEVCDWPDFKKALKLLEEDDRFKTIVIDTIDIAYRYCLEWVQKIALAGEHPADLKYGKGWDRLKDEFQKRIAQLCKLGKGVIFLSHEVVREEEKADGRDIETVQPSMSGVCRNAVEPMIDLLGYYHYDSDDDRMLRIEGTRKITAGCRMKEGGFFPGVDEIDMGESSKEAYRNLLAAMPPSKGKRRTRKRN